VAIQAQISPWKNAKSSTSSSSKPSERRFYDARIELLRTRKERKKSEIGFESQKAAERTFEPEMLLPEPLGCALKKVGPRTIRGPVVREEALNLPVG